MSTTETLTLSDFLLARIAEDEAVAKAATPGPWTADRNMGDDLHFGSMQFTNLNATERNLFSVAAMPLDTAQHIARHDPARVLAECEARRRIVEEFEARDTTAGILTQEEAWGLEHAIALLALPYADHPDYREEWKP